MNSYFRDLYHEDRIFFPNEQHKTDYKSNNISSSKTIKKCDKELFNIVAFKSCLQTVEVMKDKIIHFNLASIRFVDMNNLHLTEIDSQTFKGNKKIESIHLDINDIKLIPEDLFQGLENSLTFINLSFNRLRSLQPRTFTNLLNLGAIDLSYNKIEFIEPTLFNGLVHLTDLNLSHNVIASLSPLLFSNLNNLLNLHLSGNEITFLNAEAFKGLVNLRRLFLGCNKLAKVPVEIFDYLTSIDFFNLQNNKLNENYFIYLQSLRKDVKFIFH